jgi:xylan 1,4-beta-xylosidase
LAHLAARPIEHKGHRRCPLGRETCLQRVRWTEDGWLRLDHSGAAKSPPEEGKAPWHPRTRVAAPAGLRLVAASPAANRDDFDAPALDAGWSSLRVPMVESWLTLRERPGWLRLRGRDSLHSLFEQSFVAKPLRSVHCVAETCLEFTPGAFTEAAGLVCYYDTRTHYYLRVTHDEAVGRVLGIVQTDDGVFREPPASEQIVVNDWPRYFLRAEIEGAALQFSASPDGRSWQKVGAVLDASKLSDDYGSVLHFTGAMVGLCAQDLGAHRATADFDSFTLEDRTS